MIVLKDVNKKFGDKAVLENISFHIAPGEKVGIIGQNGAGKTTLLRVISGILKPDDGFIRIHNTENPLASYSVLRNIAYVSGTQSQLWKDMKIKDSFDNCVKMYKIPKEDAKKRLNRLIDTFAIQSMLSKTPETLSLGERMRCELVYALIAQTPILMMDEAMIGLDVSIKHKIMQHLEEYCQKKQCTMIYTSHNLIEVEKLCDRVILIDKGKILFDGSIDRIMREFSPLYHMEIKIGENLPDLEDLPIEKLSIQKDFLHIVYDTKKIETVQIMKHLMSKIRLEDVRLYEPDLEGTIKKIYERIN